MENKDKKYVVCRDKDTGRQLWMSVSCVKLTLMLGSTVHYDMTAFADDDTKHHHPLRIGTVEVLGYADTDEEAKLIFLSQ